MKALFSLITVLALAAIPLHAKDTKADAKAKKEDKAKKDEKKEMLYTATISLNMGDATEADVAEVEKALSEAKDFKCKGVKLDGKQIVATLSIDKGRLSKSAVNACLKESKKYKVDKLDDVKPEKPKKEDKKEEKKDA